MIHNEASRDVALRMGFRLGAEVGFCVGRLGRIQGSTDVIPISGQRKAGLRISAGHLFERKASDFVVIASVARVWLHQTD